MCRGDAQVVAHVAEGVIGRVEAQLALEYPVVADVLPGHPAEVAAQHASGGIAVLQATDLVGKGRIGVAIDLGLGVGADDQLRRRDGQLAVLAHQLVTLAEILAAIGVTGDRVLPDVRRLGRRGAGGRLVEVVELAVDVGVDGVDAGHRGRQSRIHITVDAGSVIGGQGGGLLAGKDVTGSGGGLEHLHLGALGEAVERSLAHEQVQAGIDAAGLAAEAEDQFLGQAGADVVLQLVGHADHAAEALDAPTGAPVSGPGGDAAVAGGDGEPAGRTAVRGGGDVAAVDLVAQVGHQIVRRVVGREAGGTADPPIGQRGEHQAVELAVAVGGQRVVAGGADAVGLENPRTDAGDDVLRGAGHALVDERIEHRAARGHTGGVALPVLERTVEGLQRQVAGVVVPGSQVDATGAAGEVGGDQCGTGLLADLAGGAGLHPQGAAAQVDDATGLRRAAAEEADVAAGADCQAAVAEQDRRRDIHRTGRSGGDQLQAATGAAQVAGDQRRFHRQPVAGAEGHLAACQRTGNHRGIHRRVAAGAVGAPHRAGGAAGCDDAQGGRVEQPGATVAVGCGDADVGAVGDAQVDLAGGLHQASVAALGAAAREDPPVHAGIAVGPDHRQAAIALAGSRDVDAGALGQRSVLRSWQLAAALEVAADAHAAALCGAAGVDAGGARQGHLLPADQHVAAALRTADVDLAGDLDVPGLAYQRHAALAHLGTAGEDHAGQVDRVVDHPGSLLGGDQHATAVGLDRAAVADQRLGILRLAGNRVGHGDGHQAIAVEVDGRGVAGGHRHGAETGVDHAVVGHGRRDEGRQAFLRDADAAVVDDPRVGVSGLVEDQLALAEVFVADVRRGGDQGAHVDLGRAAEYHAVGVVDDHLAGRGDAPGDHTFLACGDPVQGRRGHAGLVEAHRLVGGDVEALPVDDRALGALVDQRGLALLADLDLVGVELGTGRCRHGRVDAGDGEHEGAAGGKDETPFPTSFRRGALAALAIRTDHENLPICVAHVSFPALHFVS
ncbi:hypothetical protein PAERUG_P58_London_29_09_13_02932 [Pseudomonas aeruginosa]|nr:hypothetical protein PAERUG_P20_London_17_VIM_2_05_10_00026 [Pseudomonas aeruginosa]CRN30143.1 hypothetical protein PAERUG_P40_Scotland_4_VIM_2_09_12_02170 [Pseudomonas aeruginosa]CRN31457.1 hypothetical protein PAERUG_P17_North_West_14_VIM_2_03_10_00313 [Pseudomonas aeruginosa]CRN39624.1 hypothetical protein PAERUG_E8_London_17_VIM_2_04_13_00374 [Pseudomonas aeruginosa]CRN40011.1 hypothetical protein PAERUG_P24_London_17_VIM_2_08_10_01944 [Pseudomonas aeruginosa]